MGNKKKEGIPSYAFGAPLPEMNRQITSREQTMIYEETISDSGYLFEKELLYYVSNGMPDKIRTMTASYGKMPQLAQDSLRNCKNALIILNTMCQRAAISGGLNPTVSYQMGSAYLQKIETAHSMDELLALNGLAVDYGKRVAEALYSQTKNPRINQAMHYVQQNYHKKLSVGEIADQVGVTPEYLSSCFHKEVGITLPEYINRQKITVAKRLLLFSEMSLSEIAVFLSFSSQSYFQAIFKKITGVTPSEYRRQEELSFLSY